MLPDPPSTLLISPFFDTATPGGGVLYSVDVACEWLQRGRRVVVLCADRKRTLGELQRYVDEGQLSLHPILSFDQMRFTHHPHENVGRLAAEIIREVQPDVIHVHNIHGMLAAVRAATESTVPVVLTALDFGLLCLNFYLYPGTAKPCDGPASSGLCADCIRRAIHGPAAAIGAKLPRAVTRKLWPRFNQLDQIQSVAELQASLRHIVRCLDAIIAPSPVMADQLCRHGVARDRVTNMLYGVAAEKILRPVKTPSESLRFAYFGTAESIKGLHILTGAASLLPDGLPLAIRAIGGHQVRLFLEKQPVRVRRYVRYEPALFGRRLAEAHATIDAVLVPSIWHENSPFVVLESLANGTAVIGSDTSGINHLIIHDHNGWLIEPGRPAAWARAFIEAVLRPARIRRMQQNAHFTRTTADFVNDLEELESALIPGRARPAFVMV